MRERADRFFDKALPRYVPGGKPRETCRLHDFSVDSEMQQTKSWPSLALSAGEGGLACVRACVRVACVCACVRVACVCACVCVRRLRLPVPSK
jgi:hypothetical protein